MEMVVDTEEGAGNAGLLGTINSSASYVGEADQVMSDVTDEAHVAHDSEPMSDVTPQSHVCTSAGTSSAVVHPPNDIQTGCGVARLLAAIKRRDAVEVKFILTNDSNPCDLICSSKYRRQPLKYALESGCIKIIKIIIQFLRRNNRINELNKYIDNKHSLIHLAVINCNSTVVVAILQTRNRDIIFHTTANGNNMLHLATYYGITYLVATILNEGYLEAHDVHKFIHARNDNQEQPLHVAALEGHSDIAAILCKKGAHLESKSANGNTPLLMAAERGQYDTMQILLQLGADATAETSDRKSTLDIVNSECSNDVLLSLLRGGAKLTDNIMQNLHLDMMKNVLDRCLSYSPPSALRAEHCAMFVSPFGRNMLDVNNFLILARSAKFQYLMYHPTMQILIEIKYHSMREKTYTRGIDFVPNTPLQEKAELILQMDGSYFALQPHEQGIQEAEFCLSDGHCLRSGPRAITTPYSLPPGILGLLVDLFMARGVPLPAPQVPRQLGAQPFCP